MRERPFLIYTQQLCQIRKDYTPYYVHIYVYLNDYIINVVRQNCLSYINVCPFNNITNI